MKNIILNEIKLHELEKIFKIKLKNNTIDEYIGLCPFHKEKKPSFNIFWKNNTYLFYCSRCNESGDIIKGYAKIYNLDCKLNYDKIMNDFSKIIEECKPYNVINNKLNYEKNSVYFWLNFNKFNEQLLNNENAKKHLYEKGIKNFDVFGYDEFNKFYLILYETDVNISIINYKPDRKIQYLLQKNIKNFYPFNFINIKKMDSLWITKSIFSALYLCQNHNKQAIAILQNKILSKTLKLFKNFKEIIFAFDNSDNYKIDNEKYIKTLIKNGINNIKYIDYKKINFKYKNINKAFQATDYEQINIFFSPQALKNNVVNDTFEIFYKFIKNKKDQEQNIIKKYLGYELLLFKELCKNIDGVQPGLYLIAAASNVGKTSFLINILMDLIITNNTNFTQKESILSVFISLDDTKNTIINRIISYLCEIKINDIQKNINTDYHKNKIEEAYNNLLNLVEKNLLIIFDEIDINDIKILENNIHKAYNINKNLVIFIDGLQNVETGLDDIRKSNIYIAKKMKEISNKYNIPILSTVEILKNAQNNKTNLSLSDIMETGKYCYNASVIWFLSEKYTEDCFEDISYLNLSYGKNKLSHYKGNQLLKFVKSYSKIYEVSLINKNFKKNIKTNNSLGRIEK